MDGQFKEERLNGGNYFPANFDKPHDFKLIVNAKLARRISITSNYAYSTGRPITYPVAFYKFNNTYRIFMMEITLLYLCSAKILRENNF